jgi:putative oxidoreductase
MQRLFSNFANSWPGIGLLIQRLLMGTALFHSSALRLGHAHDLTGTFVSVAEGAAAILLVLGLWTPGVSLLAALIELLGLSLHMADLCTAIMVATLAITLAMIGPGAWSLDARLFGRKHLEIPNR